MGTKILKGVLFLLSTSFFLSSSCKKSAPRRCVFSPRYSFAVTASVSPQKEVYNLGDTIFISSSFPKTLIDFVSNERVDYSNAYMGIGGNFGTIQIDTLARAMIGNLSKFEIINFIGTTSVIPNFPNSGVNIIFVENTNSYDLKVGVKLLSKGLFLFSLSDLYSQGISGKDCTNATFVTTVTNSNKNINIFQYGLGYLPDNNLASRIFCFRVQ